MHPRIAGLILVFFWAGLMAGIHLYVGNAYLPTVEHQGTRFPANPLVATAMTAQHFWNTGSFNQPLFAQARGLAIELSKASPGSYIMPDLYATARDGSLWPKHCLLISILAAPFYGLGGTFGIWLFNQLLLSALFCAMLSLATQMTSPRPAFYACALFTLLSKIFWASTYTLSYDVLAAACILGGMALFPRHAFLAGLLAAAAIWIRVTHVLFLPFLAIAGMWHYGLRPGSVEMRTLGLGLLAGCLPWMAFNAVVFGHPIGGSYQASDFYMDGTAYPDIGSHRFALSYLAENWRHRLFNLREGLLPFNPIYLVLLFLPLARHHRHCKTLALLMAAALAYALLMLCFSFWEDCGGDRFALASTALLVLPLAVYLERVMQKTAKPS
jgi:hypothetical protein